MIYAYSTGSSSFNYHGPNRGSFVLSLTSTGSVDVNKSTSSSDAADQQSADDLGN